jgi:hypothetical protein
MGLFTFNVYNDNTRVLKAIRNLKNTIMAALDTLKEQLATSDEEIDILTTAIEGVAQDIAFIKAKLEANTGGIDAAGVAELSALVNAQSEKLSTAATRLQELDAETDSSTPQP